MKRAIDLFISSFLLVLLSPLILIFSLLVFLQDFKSPFYLGERMGKDFRKFRMVKLRSMVINAHKTGVNSTSSNDLRITPIGSIIRKIKLDELTQLFNVMNGTMSLVGPRPQVEEDTNLYSDEEKVLLSIRPGITDFSSIVFSDEGEILKDFDDPDLGYQQLIRPWKSKLGLFYIGNQSSLLDIKLLFLTALAIINKRIVLRSLVKELKKLNAEDDLIKVASRTNELMPSIAPGKKEIFYSREV